MGHHLLTVTTTSNLERTYTMTTTKELLAQLNSLRAENGKAPLASWKAGMPKLEAAIETEQQAIAKRMADEGEVIHDETGMLGDVDGAGNPIEPDEADGVLSVEELPSVAGVNDPYLDPQTGDDVQTQEAAPSDLSDVGGRTEASPEAPAIPRGAIGAMSIELLSGTDLPYDEIVARIKAVYPAAKTTARSLASVAMDLRNDGVDVPSRRKPAKAKPAKTTEAAGE